MGPSLAQVTSLNLELVSLRGLHWEFLAMQIESLTTAMRGGEGIPESQVVRLRRWARNFSSLPRELQDFYRIESQHEPKIGAVLFIVLDQEKHLVGPLRGLVGRLYRERYGHDPSFSFSLPTTLRR